MDVLFTPEHERVKTPIWTAYLPHTENNNWLEPESVRLKSWEATAVSSGVFPSTSQ